MPTLFQEARGRIDIVKEELLPVSHVSPAVLTRLTTVNGAVGSTLVEDEGKYRPPADVWGWYLQSGAGPNLRVARHRRETSLKLETSTCVIQVE